MNGRKLALLVAILMVGGAVEGTFDARNHFRFGPQGCHLRGGRFDGPSFAFEEERQVAVPAGIALRLENAHGRVTVSAGPAGNVRVRLHKQVFAQDETKAREFSQRVVLKTDLQGTALAVGTNRQELERGDDGEVGLESTFDVEVPADTRVVVANEHGQVTVRGVQSADLDTSHEDLEVEHIQGDAKLNIEHGETHVLGVGGALSLHGRHGNASVREVAGKLSVDMEHGDLEVAQAGATEVRLNHGQAKLSQLTGGLRFGGEHAEVEADDVTGDANVETAHKDVKLHDVKGNARVKVQHGGVDMADVTGSATIDAAFNDVSLVRVAGRVDVKLEHGGLRAERLLGGGRVSASGEDVSLEGFKGAFEITTQRAGVRLVPDGPIVESLRVETKNGNINLVVPAGSQFDVHADARFGEVHADDIAGMSVTSSGDDRLRARVGAGGVTVTLTSEHGDVRLEGRSTQARSE
jgi:DUF4097 and DUF4098 domain-containing protein YvlB